MVYQDPLLAYVPDGKLRRRRKKRSDLNDEFFVTQPESWQKQFQSYQDWRDSSPTLQVLRNNAAKLQQTCDAVKRGFQQAQSQLVGQVDSSRDAVVVALKQQLKSARAKLRRAIQQQQQQQQHKASEDCSSDLKASSKCVSGSQQDSQKFAVGSIVFGALAFACGSAPWALPHLYLVFAVVALPWRVYEFYHKRMSFFLLDFCYWANLAAVWYLLCGSSSPHIGPMVYALTDGPLAGALVVWQSAWVFGSATHSVSVLVHLLPGMALFAQRHFQLPGSVSHVKLLKLASYASRRDGSSTFGSCLVAPFVFYATWQIIYWFIVQVCCQHYIKRHQYETSYSCLAKRAAKTNNVWNQIVRKGCKARRLCMFGGLQLVFTLGCLLLFIPLYHSFCLSCIWQVLKIAFPVYYGSRYQCEKVPQHQLIRAVQNKKVQISLTAEAKAAMTPGKVHQ